MSTLYVIAQLHRSDAVAEQAIRTWRTQSNPVVLHFNTSDRLGALLNLIDDECVVLSECCFAIDCDDWSACSDFNAFLHALRSSERVGARSPSVIRSVSCHV